MNPYTMDRIDGDMEMSERQRLRIHELSQGGGEGEVAVASELTWILERERRDRFLIFMGLFMNAEINNCQFNGDYEKAHELVKRKAHKILSCASNIVSENGTPSARNLTK